MLLFLFLSSHPFPLHHPCIFLGSKLPFLLYSCPILLRLSSSSLVPLSLFLFPADGIGNGRKVLAPDRCFAFSVVPSSCSSFLPVAPCSNYPFFLLHPFLPSSLLSYLYFVCLSPSISFLFLLSLIVVSLFFLLYPLSVFLIPFPFPLPSPVLACVLPFRSYSL